ncbi:protein of unknown function [Burkholderia multivorans]
MQPVEWHDREEIRERRLPGQVAFNEPFFDAGGVSDEAMVEAHGNGRIVAE